MSALSDLLFTQIPATLYLAAFHSDPALSQDPITVEAIAAHYSRRACTWTRSGNFLVYNQAEAFNGMVEQSYIVALGLWDRQTNGRLRFSWPITPQHFTKGGVLAVNGFTLALPN